MKNDEKGQDISKISDILPRIFTGGMKSTPEQKARGGFKKNRSLSEKTVERKVEIMVSLSQHIHDFPETHERTEALILAKLLAITSMPMKRTSRRDFSKIFRLGTKGDKCWVKVTLTTQKDQELPFGEDRFVLAGIMHLAIENDSPIVFFEHAGELLKMFDISRDCFGYRTLRERFGRISGLSITVKYGRSKEELGENNVGENMYVVHRYALPTKEAIEKEKQGQMVLKGVLNNPELNNSPYGVKLGSEFWEYISETKNQLIIPINLLKLFKDCPSGWDYALFLVSRCGSAKTNSVIDHETLMTLFRDGKEDDRHTIARLKKYHRQIMTATNNHLNAQIMDDGFFKSTGRGRKKKKWKLFVGPSNPIVCSGKVPRILEIETN